MFILLCLVVRFNFFKQKSTVVREMSHDHHGHSHSGGQCGSAQQQQDQGPETVESMCATGKLASLVLTWAQGLDVANYYVHVDGINTSSLMWACIKGHLPVVKFLVDHQAPINFATNDGQTALMWAVSEGRYEVVHFLLERGADVCARDARGINAHAAAVQHENLAMLMLLHEYSPLDPQSRDSEQHTLAHWAAYKGCLNVLEYLHTLHVPLDTPDVHKRTPLHWAAREGRELCIAFLMRHGARTDAIDNDEKRPLEYAQQRGHREAAKILCGPNPPPVPDLQLGTMQLIVKNKFALLSAICGVVYTLVVFAGTHFVPCFFAHLPVMLYFAKNFGWSMLFKRPDWSTVSAFDRRLAAGDMTPRTVDESVEGMWLCGYREPASIFVVFGFITLQIAAFNEVGISPPLVFWILSSMFTMAVLAMKMTAFTAIVLRGSLADSPVAAAVKERRLGSLHGRMIDQDLHVRVPLRAFYCRQLDCLVRFYDSWSNAFDCPIGRYNHRWFIYALLSFFVLELSVLTFSWQHFSQMLCQSSDAHGWLATGFYLAVHGLPCRDVPVDDSWYHYIVPSTANHAGVWLIVYSILALLGVTYILARQLRRIGKGLTKSEEEVPFSPNVNGEVVSIYTRAGRCIYSEGNFAANILLMLLGQWGVRWDGVFSVPSV